MPVIVCKCSGRGAMKKMMAMPLISIHLEADRKERRVAIRLDEYVFRKCALNIGIRQKNLRRREKARLINITV